MKILNDIAYEIGESVFDLRYGVQTNGQVDLDRLSISGPHRKFGLRYQATTEKRFAKILKLLPSRCKAGGFVDFGCGKGRVALLAALAGFRRVYGVEFARELFEQAQFNLEILGVENALLTHGDAADYPIPADTTVFYFYNPFESPVLIRVLDNIARSLHDHPRESWAVYVTPRHPEAFDSGPFELIKKLDRYAMQNLTLYHAPARPRHTHFQAVYERTLSRRA